MQSLIAVRCVTEKSAGISVRALFYMFLELTRKVQMLGSGVSARLSQVAIRATGYCECHRPKAAQMPLSKR